MRPIFTRKIQRRAGMLRNRKGREASQKMEKLRSDAAVMSALAGKVLARQVAKDGQMASIMACTARLPR